MKIETITIDTEQWAVVPRVLLEEITESLACELDARYPACNRSYPSQERKYLAEMEPVIKAREILAAAPRPEAGRQDGSVTDYGGIDQQSEFIQLFNAAFEALKHGHSIGVCWDLMKAARAELSKHAKQRPAPRPVQKCLKCNDTGCYPIGSSCLCDHRALALVPDCEPKTEPTPVPADYSPIWEAFPGYLIDKHEGDIISEEFLQFALADMLNDPAYNKQPRPVPTAIPMSERLPVHTDADYSGLIFAFTRFTKEWVLQAWTHVHNCPNAYTHWQPTGLVRPAEPERELSPEFRQAAWDALKSSGKKVADAKKAEPDGGAV